MSYLRDGKTSEEMSPENYQRNCKIAMWMGLRFQATRTGCIKPKSVKGPPACSEIYKIQDTDGTMILEGAQKR